MRRRLVVALLLAAPALLADPAGKRGKATSNLIRVPVWTADGAPLDPADVVAKVDGAPAKVLHLAGPADDLLLLIVADLAGDLTLVDPARQALVAAIRALPDNAYVGLLRSQDGLRVVVDPGPDREAVADALLGMAVSGRAGLLDTVATATRLGDSILARARVRLAVLYVTDSHVANYREDFTNPVVNSSDSRDLSRRFPEGLIKEKISQIEKNLGRTQTPVSIVHLSYRSDRMNEAYQTGLLSLASTTGGTAQFCRSLAEIPVAIRDTIDSIARHHSVEIQLPAEPSRLTAVELAAEGRTLRYRTRFQLRER
jgi:hypothetical protein